MKDSVWGADLAHMQLIGKINKGFCFLCVIDVYIKCCSFGRQKGYLLQLLMLFKEMLDESNHKPSKIWVDKKIVHFTMVNYKIQQYIPKLN